MGKRKEGDAEEDSDSDSDSDDTDVGIKVESDKAEDDIVDDYDEDTLVGEDDVVGKDAADVGDAASHAPTSTTPSDASDGTIDPLTLNAKQLQFAKAIAEAISKL